MLTVPDLPSARPGEGTTTPTTPRPNNSFFPDSKPTEEARTEDPSVKTPTRTTFAGLAGQRPLPSSPFTPSRQLSETPSNKSDGSRENSHRSAQSVDSPQDVQMGDDDDDEKDGSDNESVTSDTNRPSKKKKGQRFFCTEFPPCNLSFTRSEHLARHIRYVWCHVLRLTTNFHLASILASDPFNATALAGSRDSTICDNMPRLFT